MDIPTHNRRFLKYLGAVSLATFFILAAILASFAILQHNNIVTILAYRQVLLVIISVAVIAVGIAEQRRRNKAIFFLLSGLGICELANIGYYFVPLLDPSDPFTGHMYYQLVNCSLGVFGQSVIIVIGVLMMNSRMRLWIVGPFVCFGFLLLIAPATYRAFENPRYLYTTPDITDFRIIDRAWMGVHQERGRVTAEDVATRVGLSKWEKGRWRGRLSHEQTLERIIEIEPYLFGSNYNMLIYRPLNELVSNINLAVVLVLFIVMISWLWGMIPQGPYFDKITAVFFVVSSLNVFHYRTYANLISYKDYLSYFSVGSVLSILSLLALLVLIVLRLRFVLSSEGQFHERSLSDNKVRVTLWRDGLDNYLIRWMFKSNSFKLRFLQKSPE